MDCCEYFDLTDLVDIIRLVLNMDVWLFYVLEFLRGVTSLFVVFYIAPHFLRAVLILFQKRKNSLRWLFFESFLDKTLES